MRHSSAIGLLGAAACALSSPSAASPPSVDSAPPAGLESVLPGSRELSITAADGSPYRILIWMPPGEAPPDGWPVLYVLDGDATFVSAAQAMRMQSTAPELSGVEPAIVVGIAYPGGEPFDGKRRWHDFTPTPDRPPFPTPPDAPKINPGGAAAFTSVLENQVMPLVAQQARVDRSRQALFGHSLGGLYALHILFTRPQMFQNYIASSSALWWDECHVCRDMDAAEARRENWAGRGLLQTAGGWEHELSPMARNAPDAAEAAKRVADDKAIDDRFAARFQSDAMASLRFSYRVLPDQDHVSVVPVVMNDALRFAFAPRPAAQPVP